MVKKNPAAEWWFCRGEKKTFLWWLYSCKSALCKLFWQHYCSCMMIFCGKNLTFYLECENCDLRSQAGSLFDITWHFEPPVTPELRGKTCIIYHQAKWDKYDIAVIALDTLVYLLCTVGSRFSTMHAWWHSACSSRKQRNKHPQRYSALWSTNPNLINSGSWESRKWSPLDAMIKARLLPFSRLALARPGGFTFGPDNIWQPCPSRRFCLNLLCPLGADAARPAASTQPLSAAPRILRIPSPAVTCCSWTVARSASCALLLIINSHSWQTAPAVMILWDSSRPFEIPLSGHLFGVRPRSHLRILNRKDSFHFRIIANKYSLR